jgi:predicted house-cleaning noncanonical NTP pyrophosphatase (MazG superfamily)
MEIDRETVILYSSLGFLVGIISMYVAYQTRLIEKYEEENSEIIEDKLANELEELLEDESNDVGGISSDEIKQFIEDAKAEEGATIDPPSPWEMMLRDE